MTYWIDHRTTDIGCAVCGDHARKPLVIGAQHVTRPAVTVEFARCAACGSLTSTAPALDYEDIENAGAGAFLRRYLESTAGPWEMFWPPASVVGAAQMSYLDIGCGFGLTVDAWTTLYGQRAVGCDPARYAAAGRRLLGEHIHCAMLDDVASLAGARFDIVYASEVIEHVADPAAFVASLKLRVSEGGVLVLTTPAAEFVQPGNDPATVEAALGAGFHAFLMSAQSLQAVLVAAGWAHVRVEQFRERLIAWASMRPIECVPPGQTRAAYLDYLRRVVARPLPPDDEVAMALRSGFAYRLLKERMFGGDLAGIEALAAQVEQAQYDLLGQRPRSLASLREALAAVEPGAAAFAGTARYHLPQVALLLGVFYQAVRGDAATAQGWLELCLTSAEKLCGPTITNSLEAGAFYWLAMARLSSYDIAQGRIDAGAAKLARMTASLAQPDPIIGGSSASDSEYVAHFNGSVDALVARRQGATLQHLAGHMITAGYPRSAATDHHVAFAANVLRHAAYLAAGATAAAADALRELRDRSAGSSARADWMTALLARAESRG